MSGREVLDAVLATPGSEPSATAALRDAVHDATAPARLRPVAVTLAADITRRRWTRLLRDRLDPDLAGRIAADPAVGSLHAACARAETAGGDPRTVLDQIADAATRLPHDDDALARHLREHVDAWSDATGPLSDVDPRDPLAHDLATKPGDPAGRALEEIRRLVTTRLAERLAPHGDGISALEPDGAWAEEPAAAPVRVEMRGPAL